MKKDKNFQCEKCDMPFDNAFKLKEHVARMLGIQSEFIKSTKVFG